MRVNINAELEIDNYNIYEFLLEFKCVHGFIQQVFTELLVVPTILRPGDTAVNRAAQKEGGFIFRDSLYLTSRF